MSGITCKHIDNCFLRRTIQFYGGGAILTHYLALPCYDEDEAKNCLTYGVIEELKKVREKLSKVPEMISEARRDVSESYADRHD